MKNLWESTIFGKLQVPRGFFDFDSLRIIFAMDIYTFLESAHQDAADETIKKTKNWNLFFDSMRVSAIFQWRFW